MSVQGVKETSEGIITEIDSLKMDIVALTETKKKGNGVETINNYVHIIQWDSKTQKSTKGGIHNDQQDIKIKGYLGGGVDLGDICLQFSDAPVIIPNDKEDLEYMARKLKEEYIKWEVELNTEET